MQAQDFLRPLVARGYADIGQMVDAVSWLADQPVQGLGVTAHALAAGAGYALFVYAAAAAAKPLWEAGRRSLATISMCVAVLASAALVATPFVEASGLLQRIGLTSLDVWLATISALVLSGRLAIDPIG